MKPPVEHVRVSAKGKEILIKIKRNTGLEHWNEICRVALCKSLSNPTPPPKVGKNSESTLDIEWKTFSGQYNIELSALFYMRAHNDGVDIRNKDDMTDYFKCHLERGISSLQSIKSLFQLFDVPLTNG